MARGPASNAPPPAKFIIGSIGGWSNLRGAINGNISQAHTWSKIKGSAISYAFR